MSVISHVYCLYVSLSYCNDNTDCCTCPVYIYFYITSVKQLVEKSELSSINSVGKPQLLLLDKTKEIQSINCSMLCLYSVIPHVCNYFDSVISEKKKTCSHISLYFVIDRFFFFFFTMIVFFLNVLFIDLINYKMRVMSCFD